MMNNECVVDDADVRTLLMVSSVRCYSERDALET